MDFSGGAPSGSGGVGSLFATAPGARAPEDAETDEYTLFAKAYRGVKAGEKEALDPENGAAALWMRTCELKLADYRADLSDEQRKWWQLEQNTWQLMLMLYTERLAPLAPESTDPPNPYLPPVNVVNSYLARSRPHTELATVRDWLHSCPSSLHPAEIRRGYYPYTKAALKHALQSHGGALADYDRTGYTKTLDPDGPLRPSNGTSISGGQLHPSDVDYDKAAIRTLFEYVRAGELDAACDFARQTDHSWRAASISGGALYSDPTIGEPLEDEGDDADVEMEYGRMDRKGTLKRRLWKKMCRRLAANKSLDPYEQALYGAVSGDVESVLPVCRTWEDHVWCYVNALFEDEVDRILWNAKDGYYWAHGSLAPSSTGKDVAMVEDVFTAPPPDDGLVPPSELYTPGQSIKVSLRKAFERVLRDNRPGMAQSAREPFHVAQMCLATDRAFDLLSDVVDRLANMQTVAEQQQLVHLVRFFAHLVLLLRHLDQPLDEEQSNRIVKAYVQVLEMEGKDELVALYASELRTESAVETYAQYLLSLGPSADRQTRKAALLRTLDHGLDLAKVACTAVELTLRDVHRTMPQAAADAGLGKLDVRIDDQQRKLIRSLEWLLVDRVTYIDALVQGNSLVRLFLTQGSPHVAREAFNSLVPDLIPAIGEVAPEQVQALEDQIVEHEHYKLFFECIELHTRMVMVLSQSPPDRAPADDRRSFKEAVELTTNQLHEKTLELLQNEWLREPGEFEDNVETAHAKRRRAEMSAIRKLYVPELVFRLHFGLMESGPWIPSNLQRAMNLANVIADGRYDLYLDFVSDTGNRMPEYLAQLRKTSLAILALSKTNPLSIPR